MLQKAAQVSASIYHRVELEIPRYSDKRPSIRCIPETGRTAARSLTAVAPLLAAVILWQVYPLAGEACAIGQEWQTG